MKPEDVLEIVSEHRVMQREIVKLRTVIEAQGKALIDLGIPADTKVSDLPAAVAKIKSKDQPCSP